MAQNILIPLAGMGTGVAIIVAIGRVATRWIERRHEQRMAELHGGGADVDQLRERVELLEDAAFRLQDVEERLEFAERLLTKERASNLPAGD